MKLTFFKTPVNKKFNYTPVFYDEKKDNRIHDMMGKEVSGDSEYKEALRFKLSHSWHSQKSTNVNKYHLIRPVVLLIVFTILVYLLIGKLDSFLSLFLK